MVEEPGTPRLKGGSPPVIVDPSQSRVFEMMRWSNYQDFERREWAMVAAIAAAIVVLNKLVIQDRGSNWLTLAVLAFFAGVAVVNLWLWTKVRRLKRHDRL